MARLGIEPKDKDIVNEIPETGAGSSFDKMDYQGKAQQMKVLKRWEEFKDDSWFKGLFDKEIFRLSEEIFGKMEDTECLQR